MIKLFFSHNNQLTFDFISTFRQIEDKKIQECITQQGYIIEILIIFQTNSKQSYQQMVSKWVVYSATFLSYSLIHSVRTCWASLKTVFNDQPFQFSEKFMGTLDMTVLFIIAALITIFGRQVQKYSRRKLIFGIMIGFIINLFILFAFVYKKVTSQPLYFIFYSSTAFIAFLAWPVCFYTTSQYFDSHNATALSMWSAVLQFGDLVAFLITLVVISDDTNPAYSLLCIIILLIMLLVYNYFFFRDKDNYSEHATGSNVVNQVQTAQHQIKVNLENERKPGTDSELNQVNRQRDDNKRKPEEQIQDEKEIESNNSQKKSNNNEVLYEYGSNHQPVIEEKAVNFLTVWLLPGVALPVLAFSTVKSINAIIVSWLVLYFSKIGLISQSRVIAIVWPISVVIAGFIVSKINQKVNYIVFIVTLFIAGFIFYLLEQLHVHPRQFQVIGLIAVCGLLVGGPFNQLGTCVPIKLSEDPEIRNKPCAKAAIISLMEGFSLIVCGISILIVPGIGIMRLHVMAGVLCFISALLLVGEQIRRYYQRRNTEVQIDNKQIVKKNSQEQKNKIGQIVLQNNKDQLKQEI